MIRSLFCFLVILILAISCLCIFGCTEDEPVETCDHIWKSASCSFPSTCYLCGETQGEYGTHAFSLARCTEESKCIYCGLAGDPALGHDFSNATCLNRPTCWRCGLSEGERLGHEYAPPTCTKPATCIRCPNTGEEQALGHSFKLTTCTVCNETVTVTNETELMKFLNDEINYFTTPFGKISVSFELNVRNDVYEISIGSGHLYVSEQKQSLQFLIYTEGGDTYEDGKQAFLDVLDFEMDIAKLAESVLPGRKISICFFESGYQYPSLGVGYHSNTYFPLKNYSGANSYGLAEDENGICDWYMSEAGYDAFLKCSQVLHQRPCRLHAEIKAARPEYHLFFYRYVDGIVTQ